MKPAAWIAEGSENLYWDKEEALADSNGWITPLYKGEERMTEKKLVEVGLVNFEDYIKQVSNEGYKQAIRDVVAMFRDEHVWVWEQHNYWLVAANMVQDEFLKEEDDRQD